MANSVSMTTQQAIRALRQRGYSKRRIARELGIHRNTVNHYLGGSGEPDGSKCTTIPTPGTGRREGPEDGPNGAKCPVPPPDTGRGKGPEDGPGGAKCPIPTPGSGRGEGPGDGPEGSKCPVAPPGVEGEQGGDRRGRPSECEGYRELIEKKLASGLKAKRIWQDLLEDHGFGHSYESVKRFVRRLKAQTPERVWRMECEPGEEAQVDYGTLWVRLGGKKRKIHVLRVTLSHSRKGYTEAMLRQDTESFIRGLENAFRHFGGVPLLVVLDNLKAGVLKADFFEAELNPKFAAFCDHYGVTALPTRPRTPEHKGKVERGVGYVKDSALKGRDFDALAAVNSHLRQWESHIADKRVHGTTRKEVGAHFEQSEKPALQALPRDLFPSFVEVQRRVHRDSYVEFERAYYEVPPEYIGRDVWVRSDGRLVHIFNQRMEQIAVHVRLEAGRFSRALGCGGTPKNVRESLEYWLERAARIGPDTELWAKALVFHRKAAALRTLMGLVNRLVARHGRAAVERACAKARLHGQYRHRDLENWLDRPAEQEAFGFLSEHEVIRDMADYGNLADFKQDH